MTKPATKREGPDVIKVIARNKKAFHDYQVADKLEAGLSLVGSEVKSLREGSVVLTDGYVEFHGGEAWLIGVQINEYPWANQFNHEPRRKRKLLLHRTEIKRLANKTDVRGYTIVPLSIYFKNGKAKVELALALGRRHYDKRDAQKKADAQKEMKAAGPRARRGGNGARPR